MIRFSKARPADAEALALASKEAFHSDLDCGAPGLGGPPGYDSAEWQLRMMQLGDYYKIQVEGRIAGGFIVLRLRAREYELGRIFVAPEGQNQGIGTQVMEFLWQEYPLVKRWTLDTPAWNVRTTHFYTKLGFVEVGRTPEGLVLFERRIAARPPAG